VHFLGKELNGISFFALEPDSVGISAGTYVSSRHFICCFSCLFYSFNSRLEGFFLKKILLNTFQNFSKLCNKMNEINGKDNKITLDKGEIAQRLKMALKIIV
jgi:hypothetical protein